MTRRKYSTFIKLSSVILIIVISSITNRYASEIKSLKDFKEAANHQNDDEDMEVGGAPNLPSKSQPFSMSRIGLVSQNDHDRLLSAKSNVAKEFNNPEDLTNTSQGSYLNDSQGRSIYSSLMKILHSMKHQIEKSSDRRPESRMDRKKEAASSIIDEAPIVELFRNSGIVAQSANNQANENSLNYNNSSVPKRNPRQTKKTSSGSTHSATQQTDTPSSSNQDQAQYSDIFNEPLRENFNEMGDGLASMVGGGGGGGGEDDTKLKKSTPPTTATYSSYLGPSDQVATTLKATTLNGKPANGKQHQYAVDISTGGSVPSQPTRSFSPKFEEFAPKSWGLQQTQTFFNDDPPPRSLFAISTPSISKNSKSANQESFFSPTQDPSVSFNDYEQVTTNGLSAAYNEPYQSANDPEDPPMDSMPLIAVSKTASSKANHLSRNHQNHYLANRQRIQSSSSADGGLSAKQEKPSFNSHYIDNEYLNTAQLEQQEEDGSRWPRGSAPALPEFQESLRSARPRQGSDDHYSGIHLQQIHSAPISPASFSSSSSSFSPGRPFNNQHQSPNRNKRQRNHNHQAQQQQVYYSLVSAPPQQQTFVKSLTDQIGGSGGGRVATIIQQQATPTRQNYQISRSVQTGGGGQPQRDLVNQPQTIQITAVPGLGNPSVLRLNGGAGPTVNGIALSNLLAHNGALLDPSGRQVVMVNADRRQIDWSFLIWPLLVVIVLPLVLSALFVPIFMKSLVLFLQILQSLGLVMPISSALGLSLASGASYANITTSK